MKRIQELLEDSDIKDLQFHLDYNKMLQIMMEKRNLDTSIIEKENERILERLQELKIKST